MIGILYIRQQQKVSKDQLSFRVKFFHFLVLQSKIDLTHNLIFGTWLEKNLTLLSIICRCSKTLSIKMYLSISTHEQVYLSECLNTIELKHNPYAIKSILAVNTSTNTSNNSVLSVAYLKTYVSGD